MINDNQFINQSTTNYFNSSSGIYVNSGTHMGGFLRKIIPSINSPINQSNNQFIKILESVKLSGDSLQVSINQSINQLINYSVNQSMCSREILDKILSFSEVIHLSINQSWSTIINL